MEILAPALAVSKQIVAVDLSQNGLTPKSAASISGIVSQNDSIIDLNLSSMQGAQRNRLGKEGGLALAYGFSHNCCLIQFLNLKSVTLGNEEVNLLASSL